ncbi:MAG: tetratricopeptide repeat protein [Microscillaceae bacterium]|nr:tetratricopeptide repeat protein [Microscillaceae bacterium]
MREIFTIIFVILSLGLCGQIQEQHLSDDLHYLKNIRFFVQKQSDSTHKLPLTLVNLCSQLMNQKKKSSNELVFLKKVFLKVQQTYFKTYDQFSTLEILLNEGRYDCVSGTSLYALILNTLGFKVEIHETPFHTFLLVFLSNNQRVLVESTSPGYGVITGDAKITEMIHQFTYLNRQKLLEDVIVLDRHISIQELAGLENYNQAVYHFNKQEYQKANEYLDQALRLYPCDRVNALKDLNQEVYAGQ